MFQRRALRATKHFDATACLLCQWRAFSTSYHHFAQTGPPTPAPIPPTSRDPLANAPRSYGKAVTKYTPVPLSRPIGLAIRPQAGQNTGVDLRTIKQKRDDFVNYDKHLARRKELTEKISTPYFREWKNMNLHKGKTFLPPPRVFKADHALYFPNFYGRTLLKDKKLRDSTPVLENKVSIVSVYNSSWGLNQAKTFASAKQNPAIHELVKASGGIAQFAHISIEEQRLKAMFIKLFMGSLRKEMGQANWDKYFLVEKGVTDEMRECCGMLNSKVGYTFLLDQECRIRWAGSGDANDSEKEGLVKAARTVIEQLKMKKQKMLEPRPQPEAAARPTKKGRGAALAA